MIRIPLARATVLAMVVSSQVLAASTVTYTLEIGGNNNATNYENGQFLAYGRTALPNGGEGMVIVENGDVNWAVLVRVEGLYADPGNLGDGLLPGGAANLVFDLELHVGAADGPLAPVGPAPLAPADPGQPTKQWVPTDKGWYSTINDGDADGIRDGTILPRDTVENAAYPTVFNIDGKMNRGGRMFDAARSGGPFVDFYHYPSASGRPTGATAAIGKLVGMGIGYKEFKPTFFGGPNTAGVGLLADSGSCTRLGELPLFEGQICTRGLCGTYTLVLKAGLGNNVLPGHTTAYPICTVGPNGRFALPADKAPNTVVEDTIWFIGPWVGCGGEPCFFQAARSQKDHAGTIYSIEMVTGAVEDRAGGVTQVVTDFSESIQLVGPIPVTVSSGTVTSNTLTGPRQLTTVMSGATNGQPLTIAYPGVANAANPALRCTGHACVAVLVGDVQGDMTVNILDLVTIRNSLNQTVTSSNFRTDVNFDGAINILDLVTVRNNLNLNGTACP